MELFIYLKVSVKLLTCAWIKWTTRQGERSVGLHTLASNTVKPVLRDHLSWQITHFWQKDLHFNITESVTKDHLSWQTTFLWSMGWSFKTGSTVSVLHVGENSWWWWFSLQVSTTFVLQNPNALEVDLSRPPKVKSNDTLFGLPSHGFLSVFRSSMSYDGVSFPVLILRSISHRGRSLRDDENPGKDTGNDMKLFPCDDVLLLYILNKFLGSVSLSVYLILLECWFQTESMAT